MKEAGVLVHPGPLYAFRPTANFGEHTQANFRELLF